MKKEYIIKEVWKMCGGTETYENCRPNLIEVRKYIKDWIEAWENSANENEYKFLGSKTDYRTYASLRIKTDYGTDYFYLKVTN